MGCKFPRSGTVENQWCFSHTALDGCQMEMPFTGDNKYTKNLILLLLSFLTPSLGNGWGRFSLTDGCEIGFLSWTSTLIVSELTLSLDFYFFLCTHTHTRAYVCVCVMHEHRKSVFLVLRVNCWVLKVQSPVWFECVLPEFAQSARGGKSCRTKAWQPGLSSVIFMQTDKACA